MCHFPSVFNFRNPTAVSNGIWYNTGMAKAKPILYGVSDFVRMRTEGAYYIDRTAYIRELERGMKGQSLLI